MKWRRRISRDSHRCLSQSCTAATWSQGKGDLGPWPQGILLGMLSQVSSALHLPQNVIFDGELVSRA